MVFSNNLLLGAVSAAADAYLIEQSLLFNDDDSAYLNRTPSVAGNRKTWTWSGWMKRANIDAYQHFICAGPSGSDFFVSRFGTTGKLELWDYSSATDHLKYITTAVFNDSSAWYHIVFAVDTTQATASNRVKIYVNGVQVTAFDTETDPSLNFDTHINSSSYKHEIGALTGSGANVYTDGLMALPILVDGAALDASSFGELDDDGFWNPIEFTGATTTTDNVSVGGTASAETTFLSFVPANAFDGNTSTRWISSATPAWLEYDRGSGNGVISTSYSISCGPSGSASTADMPKNWTIEGYNGSSWDTLATVTGEAAWSLGETRLYTFTNTTSYEKYRIDITLQQGGGAEIEVGELRFYAAGTGFGTNGFVLDFSDTAAFGDDTSGNTNDYTSNNFVAADQLEDSPTDSSGDSIGNFSTWNPNNGGGVTVGVPSEGNLQFTNAAANYKGLVSTIAFPTSGKWGVQFTITGSVSGSNDGDICIVRDQFGSPTAARTRFIATTAANYTTFGLHMNGGDIKYKFNGGSAVTHYNGAASATSDVYEFLFDADNGYFDVKENGSAFGTQLTGIPTGELYWLCADMYATGILVDFGQQGYVPSESGYSALATQNLPAPTIADGSQQFTPVIYTGTGSELAITSLDFTPDFVWIKNRDATDNHMLYDSVRGATKDLHSNTTDAETTTAQTLKSFDSAGFTLGTDVQVNTNTEDYVAWCWKAGGAASSNTDGSITTSVSANPTAGFSIISYTGTGASYPTPTIGHGLGSAPKFYIIKNRDQTDGWAVFHEDMNANPWNDRHLRLDTNAAVSGALNVSGAAPTSSIIYLDSDPIVNASSEAYICYAWSEVEGFSKFGGYTGNGSNDGPFIYTGFKPACIIFKKVSSTSNWGIFDNARDPYNEVDHILFPNLTNADVTPAYAMDFLSNGVKLRNTSDIVNVSGQTYIYMAFAEHPFQGADGVTQARAR